MAKFRQIETKFWRDPFIEQCTPEERYFYIYLITNPATRQCGIYETTIRIMAFETGYNVETIEKLIQRFEDYGKIKYSRQTNEICIINFLKYNSTSSPKVIACINQEMEAVKDRVLIGYAYGINTISQEEEEEEKEKEEEKEEEREEKKVSARSKFIKPEFIEVKNYFKEKGHPNEAQKFWDYYESTGWTIGRQAKKMTSWRNAISGWCNRINEFTKNDSNAGFNKLNEIINSGS